MKSEIIIINKDSGYTSRDVVNKLNKILNTKKIGHTGTLDPLASGVMIILTNKYTKLCDIILMDDKEYIAEIKLGLSTDTLDITGNIISKEKTKKLAIQDINKVLKDYTKEYYQEVPIYSAVHVQGKRLYEYARSNEEVELPKKLVKIKELELLDYHDDLIKIRCVVSSGTYIRALIKDICESLNVLGTMNSLIRTRVGLFTIEDSYTLEDIATNNYQSISIDKVLNITNINIDDNLYKKVINGNLLKFNYNGYVMFKYNNENIALYNFTNNIGKLVILMVK